MTSPISFKKQTVEVIRPIEWFEERGDRIPNWDTAVEHELEGCRLQPMATDEIHFTGSMEAEGGTGRHGVITRWRLFTPPQPDLESHDRVRYDGAVYEVDGAVQDWPSPTGILVHAEVILRRVDG